MARIIRACLFLSLKYVSKTVQGLAPTCLKKTEIACFCNEDIKTTYSLSSTDLSSKLLRAIVSSP